MFGGLTVLVLLMSWAKSQGARPSFSLANSDDLCETYRARPNQEAATCSCPENLLTNRACGSSGETHFYPESVKNRTKCRCVQEPDELLDWAKNSSTRARGRCTFWGAEELGALCRCPDVGSLSRYCMASYTTVKKEFDPLDFMKWDPHVNLWHPNCRCISEGERRGEHLQEPPANDFNVTAVNFCKDLFAPVHAEFPVAPNDTVRIDGEWKEWGYAWFEKRDATMLKVNSSVQLNEELCKKNLTDKWKLDEILGKAAHSFKQVCGQECPELVQKIHDNVKVIATKGTGNHGSYSDICSLIVVKDVESHLLGCCGTSCGWSEKSQSCLNWPFMSLEDRETWNAECCVEKNILRGSEREMMCQSVLPDAVAQAYLVHDLEPKGFESLHDNGLAEFVGEDDKLVWTYKGVASLLGKPAWARLGGPVYDGFLRWQPLSVQEGIKWGYWKILKKGETETPERRKLRKIKEENAARKMKLRKMREKLMQQMAEMNGHKIPEAKSLVEMKNSKQGETCTTLNVRMKTCTAPLKNIVEGTCVQQNGWKTSSRVAKCQTPQKVYVATAQECLEEKFPGVLTQGEDKWRYFHFDGSKNPSTPFVCRFATGSKKCKPQNLDLQDLAEGGEEIRFSDVWFWKATGN